MTLRYVVCSLGGRQVTASASSQAEVTDDTLTVLEADSERKPLSSP